MLRWLGIVTITFCKGVCRDGLCKCFLGGRSYLRTGSNFNGKDKDDAGTDYGHSCSVGSYHRLPWLVRALYRVCRRRRQCTSFGLWKCFDEGNKGSGR